MTVATLSKPALDEPRAAGLRRVPPTVAVSLLWLAVIVAWSLAPGLFTSHDPAAGVPTDKLLGPGAAHWFGTDDLGRDLFARVVHGSASSVSSALISVAIGVIAGSLIGLLAGFLEGWVDTVLARFVDVLLAIPGFLFAVVIVSALGFRTVNAAIATGVVAVAVFARVMRAEVIKVRQATFVEASYLQGGSRLQILLTHILPNASRSIVPLAVLQFGVAILVIAGLAFLGYGDPPPASDWGRLVADGEKFPFAPWMIYAPAAVIVATVLALNRISRWLRRPA
ncbi:ABC transporter, permease protein [Nocardioidaceae bacterium Broad-1]|uniref:ABC transporter permease n=1 Tax=Nocardioides luteus TaxID=1844 RepID=UPI000202838B|nr:ABC transporter permease [Nocardioides luteus]EGD41838.1 ABC transporter, permease protein [Nocardioidaceae bacterium Broad-1]MBG6097021.1 peptide/nickel transport system permease protein [Nocardioides luteus]